MVADLAYKTPIGELRMFVLNYYFISAPDDSNTYNLSSLPRRHASMVNKSQATVRFEQLSAQPELSLEQAAILLSDLKSLPTVYFERAILYMDRLSRMTAEVVSASTQCSIIAPSLSMRQWPQDNVSFAL